MTSAPGAWSVGNTNEAMIRSGSAAFHRNIRSIEALLTTALTMLRERTAASVCRIVSSSVDGASSPGGSQKGGGTSAGTCMSMIGNRLGCRELPTGVTTAQTAVRAR